MTTVVTLPTQIEDGRWGLGGAAVVDGGAGAGGCERQHGPPRVDVDDAVGGQAVLALELQHERLRVQREAIVGRDLEPRQLEQLLGRAHRLALVAAPDRRRQLLPRHPPDLPSTGMLVAASSCSTASSVASSKNPDGSTGNPFTVSSRWRTWTSGPSSPTRRVGNARLCCGTPVVVVTVVVVSVADPSAHARTSSATTTATTTSAGPHTAGERNDATSGWEAPPARRPP